MKFCLLTLLFIFFVSVVEGREPSIQEVQAEAKRYFGFDEQEIDRWKKRVRWSSALPRLQVGFDRDVKDVVSLTTQDNVSISGGDIFIGPDENNFDQNVDEVTRFEVKAVWFLNELIFNRDSLAVSGERRDWVRERSRFLEDVTEAFFTRRRLLQELKKDEDIPELKEQKKILLDRALATLDAHTGGWFSTQLAMKGLK